MEVKMALEGAGSSKGFWFGLHNILYQTYDMRISLENADLSTHMHLFPDLGKITPCLNFPSFVLFPKKTDSEPIFFPPKSTK